MATNDRLAALRVPAFRAYTGMWLLAMMGTHIQSVAVAWEVYVRTGEALSLGLVGLAQALPTIALALPAGHLADRFSRKLIIACSLTGMTLTSLALALVSWLDGPPLLVYALLFCDAAAVILGRPARVAWVPSLVPRKVFPNAATWSIASGQIAAVAGPALGGLVVAVSPRLAFLVAAGTSMLFLLGLTRIGSTPPARSGNGAPARPAGGVLEGLRFLWGTRLLLALISLDLFAVLLGGAVYLLPIFARDILDVGATGFGWLRAAPAFGALAMALAMAALPPLKRAGWMLLAAVAGFGVATIVFGLTRLPWLAFAMLALTGAFDNISMLVRHTLQQMLTPDAMRGRVAAVASVFIGASNQLGGMESGLVAHWFGPVVSVVSGGIGTLVVVVTTTILSPGLRAIRTLHDVQPLRWPATPRTRTLRRKSTP